LFKLQICELVIHGSYFKFVVELEIMREWYNRELGSWLSYFTKLQMKGNHKDMDWANALDLQIISTIDTPYK